MLRLPIALFVLAVLFAAFATPAPAAEQFAGVTERGRLVRFTSQNPFALTRPQTVRGLAAGERLVALGQAARGVVAVGTSARLYALDLRSARATAIGPSFPQGLRGARFSLAVAPGADRARLLSDVGQDLIVDLGSGATSDGPGLRRERDGTQVRPAADMTPDGSVVGVQINPNVLLRELARGTTTMAQSPLATPSGVPLGEPLGFQLGSDGDGYVLAVATDRQRDRQSLLVKVNPSTGGFANARLRGGQFFARRLTTFAALGPVPADRTPPRARIELPRRVSAGALLDRRLPLRVRSDEAAQVTVSMEVAGRSAGFTFDTRDTPGLFRFTQFALDARDRTRIRSGVGARIRFRIGVNDLKGNHRTTFRVARLTR
ncbi:MAG: hypothetical protein QOC68_2556 [Solirubrobacteraceae bacterium]|nr:hypothetical protein [Solirubrobacteraceae bacterium]